MWQRPTFRRHHHGVSWLPHHRQAGRTAGGTTEAGRFSPEVGDAGLHHLPVEDGKKLKMLKRHLRTTYGMTPEDYRAKWGLPADYPMVAPDYAAERSAMAVKIGLGRKRVVVPVAEPAAEPRVPRKRGRARKVA